jgi:CheY-like chemotaxis protein
MLVAYTQQFDWVVIDNQSPSDPVAELIKRIKSNPDLKTIPLVLLTADSGELADIKNTGDEFLHVIKKPYRPDFLLDEIDRLTGKQKIK